MWVFDGFGYLRLCVCLGVSRSVSDFCRVCAEFRLRGWRVHDKFPLFGRVQGSSLRLAGASTGFLDPAAGCVGVALAGVLRGVGRSQGGFSAIFGGFVLVVCYRREQVQDCWCGARRLVCGGLWGVWVFGYFVVDGCGLLYFSLQCK